MKTESFALANIARAEIITEDATPEVMTFDTSSEASIEATVSEGSDNELRVKNVIMAQNNTEDIVKGYAITLNDTVMQPNVYALVDGGTATYNSDNSFKNYIAPVAGNTVNRKKFTLSLYSEEKDYNSDVLGYLRFTYLHAKGTPAKVDLKDGEFVAPSYTIESSPKKGEAPVMITKIPNLPEYVESSEDLTDISTGSVLIVTTSITVDTKTYPAGTLLKKTAAGVEEI